MKKQSINLIRKEFDLIDNNLSQNHYFKMFKNIALSRFIYNNLPDNISSRFIEETLFEYGIVGVFDSKRFGLIATKCIPDIKNYTGEPVGYLCYTDDGKVYEYKKSGEIAVIKNTLDGENSRDYLTRYSESIANTSMIRKININAMKMPYIIQCTESQKRTFEIIYDNIIHNKPAIWTTKECDIKDINILKTDAEFLADKLQMEKVNDFNEALQFMGIETSIEKKERLIESEVNSNHRFSNICLSIFLNPRIEGIKQINKKFKQNISIELSDFSIYDYVPDKLKEGEKIE